MGKLKDFASGNKEEAKKENSEEIKENLEEEINEEVKEENSEEIKETETKKEDLPKTQTPPQKVKEYHKKEEEKQRKLQIKEYHKKEEEKQRKLQIEIKPEKEKISEETPEIETDKQASESKPEIEESKIPEKENSSKKEITKIDLSKKEIPKMTLPKKETPKIDLSKKKEKDEPDFKLEFVTEDSDSFIIAQIGREGTGKTKAIMDLINLLKPEERMLFIDTDKRKAIKIKKVWYPDKPIDILDFVITDKETFKTLDVETIEQWELIWKKQIVPYLKSGKYKILAFDKANRVWSMSVNYWLKQNPKRTKAMQRDYADIYQIALTKIFYPMINSCRELDITLAFAFDIKDKYEDEKKVGKEPDTHKIILGHLDYAVWREWDYNVYVFKHPVKAFWRFNDENIPTTSYLFDKDIILNQKEIDGKQIEFQRYEDFIEDVSLSQTQKVNQQLKMKTSINLLKNKENPSQEE